ncbi:MULTISPECIES: DUF397 domain-containing protein [Streptomyces]|uniref:DUF397 domain-containing protein n=1 Tax=Streptomyces evansiae TaxID=3075535 RepID=A0ABU2QZJ3_9ACTN|nr:MULTISPECIES: DUF397 domain-containing protein [unclassified Streptomyces]MDT0409868.1 DUF397 domain-containing protein [Streptomyces sp. DSM 41979]MYQ60070.1 DUF397 domain-containing protein [Streptomyces sp. SID4926]SCD98448.1 protein of unknown function [Streptomyces sp. DfronAA-171]
MATPNLYSFPTGEAEFKTYCGGNLGGENESCAEVAPLAGVSDAFVVRDNKPESGGAELRFTGPEMDRLALGWVRDRNLSA